jgi:hypothetical protein
MSQETATATVLVAADEIRSLESLRGVLIDEFPDPVRMIISGYTEALRPTIRQPIPKPRRRDYPTKRHVLQIQPLKRSKGEYWSGFQLRSKMATVCAAMTPP